MSRQRTSTRRMGAPSQRARTTLSLAAPYAMTVCPALACRAAALSGSAGAAVDAESGDVPAPASRARAGGPNATSARAETSTLALSTSAVPCDPSTPGADPVACQLGFSALREALHQVL